MTSDPQSDGMCTGPRAVSLSWPFSPFSSPSWLRIEKVRKPLTGQVVAPSWVRSTESSMNWLVGMLPTLSSNGEP